MARQDGGGTEQVAVAPGAGYGTVGAGGDVDEAVMPGVRRYRPTPMTVHGEPLRLDDRHWPSRVGLVRPRWCSVDLRDGNQALVEPMAPEQKLALWDELVRIGFTEIEIGFPAASGPDLDFCRMLIEQDRIPDDVTVSVLTQCRAEQLEATMRALAGARRAVVHFYNSTSALQRKVTFNAGRDEVVALAVDAARRCRELEGLASGCEVGYEYSPESFTGTELEFAVEICDAVRRALALEDGQELIVNLPATVEHQPPSQYADAVEWFCANLPERDTVCVSVHPHNDRGCAVAAAEAVVAAGADRVEGTLFGNGERTGNVDVVTLGLNLYTWGVDPGLDLSELPRVRSVYEAATGMSVHARAPYAGDLAWVAFSGSHQDAIDKGLAAVGEDRWEVPYLPVDPGDLGRSYEPVIRVNSQSGKGGVAHVVKVERGLELPRGLAAEFARSVQVEAEAAGGEVAPGRVVELFEDGYLAGGGLVLRGVEVRSDEEGTEVVAQVLDDGVPHTVRGRGAGPISALVAGLEELLGGRVEVLDYAEHAVTAGTDAVAAAYAQVAHRGGTGWGVGLDASVLTASLQSVLSAVDRLR